MGNGRRAFAVVIGTAMLGAVLVACTPPGPVAPPTTPPVGPALDLARPRILGAGVDLATIANRVTREPYRTVFVRLVANARRSDNVTLDDHTIAAERTKAKATKDLAFLYAIDRTIVDDEPAPFRNPEKRQEAGDTARTLLLNMYTRSRLAVPAPLGGYDRDINTSEELLQYASGYDTLLGAGYAFTPEDELAIRTRISDLAAELYANYVHPETAGGASIVLPNNHRSKSAAALGVAALALLDTAPAEGTPPDDIRSPAAWLAFALDQVDLIQRWTYVAPDGGYGEGPYYQRYAGQNLLPFARAWNHARGGRAWDVGGRAIPDLWTSPWYHQTHRWLLDMTLPNGALAPVDDGNVDFSYYFGTAPTTPEDAAAFAWRWANAPTPYDADGSIDLAADSLIAYDDSVVPAPPARPATRFYSEGGNAVFRSGWDADATTAVVLGEHGAAMELGRNREGLGQIASAAHEQPDTGSFTLHSFGERLLLDPGYLTYPERGLVGKASDHNLILVNGQGPADPFSASIQWVGDLAGLPPVDGQATISGTRDTPFVDAARVTSRYANTSVDRRFFFVDDRYLVVADTLNTPADQTPTFTWPLHGNGGGTSGGTFAPTPSGGQWVRGAARLDAAVATDAGPVEWSTRETNHEGPGRVLLTHTTLDAASTATGPTLHGIEVAYPSRSGEVPPTIEALPNTGDGAGIRITDTAGDRIVVAVHHADGKVSIDDTHLDGSPRVAYSEGLAKLGGATTPRVSSRGAEVLGFRVAPAQADLLATGPSRWLRAQRLPFTARRADGACALLRTPAGTYVRTGADRAVTLYAAPGNSAPAADAGTDRDNVPVGTSIRLAGRGCDVDHERLRPHWELVAAPAGSAWSLTDTTSWNPRLKVDAPGPFRARLTLTDRRGATSRPVEVEISGGPRCTGDRLTWSDPRCS